ncbi:hypothetical protein IT575_00775 [bacterium]|nr:hypothetical protein [bacterium]
MQRSANTAFAAALKAILAGLLALGLCACGQSASTGLQEGRAETGARGQMAPAGLLAGLPPLSSLGSGSSAGRSASTAEEQELAGDVLYRKSANVTLDTVGHTAAFNPADGELAFGIQEFELLPADRAASLAIELSGVDSGENVWVAIANYSSGVWQTLQPSGNGSYNIDLGGVSGVYSNGTKMYVAVLGWKAQFNLLLARLGLASGFYPGWTHTWGSPGVDIGSRMAIDADGNILFASSYDSLSAGNDDFQRMALLKMSPSGSLLQAKTFQILDDTPASELLIFAELLRKDDGTLYLVGRSNGTPSGEDGVIIKLDADLNILWARLYDTGADDDLNCAALKANGDLVCAGNSLYADDNFHQDAWLITVNGATGEMTDSKVYEITDTSEVPRYIDLDEAGGKILLAGDMDGDSLLGDAFLMSVALSGGAPNWVRQYGGPDSDYCTGISRAGNGSAVAAVNLENASDSVMLTIEGNGSLSLESGYSDEDGTVGLSVWRVIYNEASGGPQMAGARVDDQGNPVGGVTSLIQFDGDLGPLSGTTYGWYFVDWRFTPGELYTNSFTGLGATLLPTVTPAGAGSLTGKAGSGTFSSLSPTVSSPATVSTDAVVTVSETPDRFDGEITEDTDQDMLMVKRVLTQ